MHILVAISFPSFQRKRVNFPDPPITSKVMFFSDECKTQITEESGINIEKSEYKEEIENTEQSENPESSETSESSENTESDPEKALCRTEIVDTQLPTSEFKEELIKTEVCIKEETGELDKCMRVPVNGIKNEIDTNEVTNHQVDESMSETVVEPKNEETWMPVVPVESTVEESNPLPEEMDTEGTNLLEKESEVVSKETSRIEKETEVVPERTNLIVEKSCLLLEKSTQSTEECSEKLPKENDKMPELNGPSGDLLSDKLKYDTKIFNSSKLKNENIILPAGSSKILLTKETQESKVPKCQTLSETVECFVAQLKDMVSLENIILSINIVYSFFRIEIWKKI